MKLLVDWFQILLVQLLCRVCILLAMFAVSEIVPISDYFLVWVLHALLIVSKASIWNSAVLERFSFPTLRPLSWEWMNLKVLNMELVHRMTWDLLRSLCGTVILYCLVTEISICKQGAHGHFTELVSWVQPTVGHQPLSNRPPIWKLLNFSDGSVCNILTRCCVNIWNKWFAIWFWFWLLMFYVVSLTVVHMLKFVDLRKTPSLEFGMMLVFSYAPYCLAEGIHLSGAISIGFMLKVK